MYVLPVKAKDEKKVAQEGINRINESKWGASSKSK